MYVQYQLRMIPTIPKGYSENTYSNEEYTKN